MNKLIHPPIPTPPVVNQLETMMHRVVVSSSFDACMAWAWCAGVQSAEPDLKASEVAVKGVFEESKLAEYVYKRTGKHAAVVKSEPVPAPPPESGAGDNGGAKEEEKGQEEEKKKEEGGGGGGGGEEKKEGDKEEEKKDGKDGGDGEKQKEEEKEGGGGAAEKEGDKDAAAAAAASLYMHYPRFPFPGGYYAPPPGYVYQPVYPAPAYAAYAPPHHQPMAPQIFSDENPNACSVM
jgi:hypothetical protein